MSAAQQATLTGRSFFPTLITAPFRAGLHVTFDFAIAASLVAAAVSWTRGGKAAAVAPAARPVAAADRAVDAEDSEAIA